MQIVPESIRKLWNEWELRVMVLISLSLQIILIIFSNRRKYSSRIWVRVILWLTYLSADWAATVSLGVLCNSQQDSESTDGALQPDSKIMAFWAPFLLLHLGGPDTITAYALEDNELWLRHFLGLLIQVGVAFYVFLRSWTTGTYNLITFLAIPMFITGIIKYGERTYVLWSASSGHFRDSLLPHPNAGSDYVKLIEESEYDLESFKTEFRQDETVGDIQDETVGDILDRDILPDDARILHEAHSFFEIFRRLYADLIFSLPEIKHSYEVFCKKEPKDAFEVIELELSFMYDVLYTKASLVYSLAGGFLRPICFISTVSAFVGFLILDKHGYSAVDIMISYVLLVGAIVLEMYAVIKLLSSDWTMLWLRKPKSPILNGINQAISSLHSAMNEKKRWSNTISQYNLISFCLRRKPTKCLGIQNIFGIYEMLEKYQQIVVKDVSVELKEYIFKHILKKAETLAGSYEGVAKFCSWRGDEVLRNFRELSWSIEVDFDESILLWHIATHLHYYTENKFPSAHFHKSRISMLLSDYMLYVLVMRPFMLPKGIGQIRFQDTVAEAERFFEDRGLTSIEIAQEKLLEVDCQYTEVEVKGDVSKSVLFDGCRLAKTLKSLSGQNEQIWEMISNVWVEMLCYAANQCRWNQHAQQLRRGGELLTHISLLMTHLGLTEQLKVIRIREDSEDRIRRDSHALEALRKAALFRKAGTR